MRRALAIGTAPRHMPAMLVERVPVVRIRARNDVPPNAAGAYVLYWMTAARRARYNFALERAIEHARALGKPLVVLEPLRAGYEWASDRFHTFVIEGMRANAAHFAAHGVTYLPYLEPKPGEGRGLLESLAKDAAVVVGDESVTFFLPRMLEAAAARIPTRFETVDSAGLMPLSLITQPFGRAYDFRRFLQKNLAPHLRQTPLPDPLKGPLKGMRSRSAPALPDLSRWGLGASDRRVLEAPIAELVANLPIDHQVGAVEEPGGSEEASRVLKRFLDRRLSRYGEERSHPDAAAASGLSLWLHFGHVSPHEVLDGIASATEWSPDRIGVKTGGQKEGWWNASESADSFLDELVTWRELGQARCAHSTDFMQYEGVPGWARKSLEAHVIDPRPHVYSEAQLEAGETEDAIWNASMHELRATGRIQNYLRMLWGKRVLTWTRHPREAFEILVRLNDKWSIDGRDPSSYTNIGWVFGAYDRPWAPERPIFGVVRMMTSASAFRKLKMRDYVARWGTGRGALPGKPGKGGLGEGQSAIDFDD